MLWARFFFGGWGGGVFYFYFAFCFSMVNYAWLKSVIKQYSLTLGKVNCILL